VKLNIPLILAAIVVGVGCRSAVKQSDKAQAKVAAAEAKMQTNRTDQVTKAAAFTAGVGSALNSETNKSPAVMLAYSLNARASDILGPPSYSDGLVIREAVAAALSPIIAEQQRAGKLLSNLDGRVVELQRSAGQFAGEKAVAEKQRDATMDALATDADWARKWKRRLWFAGLTLAGLIMAPILLTLAAAAFPAAAPFASAASAILALPFKWLHRVVPSLAQHAGVIAKEEYDKVRGCAEELSGAIKALKAKSPDVWEKEVRQYFLSAKQDDNDATMRDIRRTAIEVKV